MGRTILVLTACLVAAGCGPTRVSEKRGVDALIEMETATLKPTAKPELPRSSAIAQAQEINRRYKFAQGFNLPLAESIGGSAYSSYHAFLLHLEDMPRLCAALKYAKDQNIEVNLGTSFDINRDSYPVTVRINFLASKDEIISFLLGGKS